MDTAKAEWTRFENLSDLKGMLASPGPCVSLYMTLAATGPEQSEKVTALEWKELVRSIEPRLQEIGANTRELLETLDDWGAILDGQSPAGKSIAVFRSPDVFCLTWLQSQVPNRAVVGPHFFLRPLLPELTRPTAFYLLALSQKNVRLLRCTLTTSEQVPLPTGTPESFDAYMNTAKPDHNRRDMQSAGPSSGHTKGIIANKDTTAEDKGEHLAHFFRVIDRAVNEALRGRSEPLVMAAVEYELPMYREVNSYPHLSAVDVNGAPNSLKSGEMHARALEALDKDYYAQIDEVLAQYDHLVGGSASNRLRDVVTASHDGRVLTLLVSDSLEKTGAFDERTHSVRGHARDAAEEEDLVNDAVVQTVLHAGQVYVAPNTKLPNGAPVAAVFRF